MWPVVVIVALLAIAAGAIWLSARGRKAARDPLLTTPAEALADVLAATLDDLRAERDPRRAVIGAYARMERAFAASGLPRRDAEAPEEYLGRVLDEVQVSPRAAGRLTALFAWARFSVHDVRPEMKDEAIETLVQVQEELAAAQVAREAQRAGSRCEAHRPCDHAGARSERVRRHRPRRRARSRLARRARVARPGPRHRARRRGGRNPPGHSSTRLRVRRRLRACTARPRTTCVPRRMEREVALASGTAFDVHYRLRPTVRSIARGLLLRKGIDLDRTPERSEALVGPDVWDLIRPDRTAPEDRSAPGLPVGAMERAVDALERLECS